MRVRESQRGGRQSLRGRPFEGDSQRTPCSTWMTFGACFERLGPRWMSLRAGESSRQRATLEARGDETQAHQKAWSTPGNPACAPETGVSLLLRRPRAGKKQP